MTDKNLITQRLLLEPVEFSDLENIHDLLSIPEVDKYNTLGIPTNIEVTSVYLDEWVENRKQRTEFAFGIKLKLDKKFIGLISIKVGLRKFQRGEVWYKLHPLFWTKGYATEALQALLVFGFHTLDLHRIEAGCAVDNVGSIKVLEKVGMIREGRKRESLPLKSGWSDHYEYGMLSKDHSR